MDPNATLSEIRQILNDVDHGKMVDVDRFAELVAALDSWLTRGGFLPNAWAYDKRHQVKRQQLKR